MKNFEVDKTKLKDTIGRPLTQSLFLEHNYSEYAYFTLNDDDKMYEGRLFPSLKKLYLEVADPTEYQFAIKHLLGWTHWQRLNENKALVKHFDQWRQELEVMLRSEALLAISDMNENFQAQRFLAEKGWEKGTVGRPKKSDPQREDAIQERIADELKGALVRMDQYEKKVA